MNQPLPAPVCALPASRSSALPWLFMLAVLWGPVVYLLGAQWSHFQPYNYGWAVPCLCIYLAWERWPTRPVASPPAHGGAAAFALIVVGLLLWITRVFQEANPVWRAASYGLATEAVAITLLLLYLTGGRGRAMHFAFPVVFFLVAVPWPTPVETGMIQTLTRLNAGVVEELLNTFGIPAMARGNVIEVSTGVVGIDEACSGIRSLQATLMVSLFFGEFYRLRLVRRLAMVTAGMGAALLFNMARMFLLTWVASRDGTQAIEKWHDPAGVTILVACFLFLWGVGAWLRQQGAGSPRAVESMNIEHPTSNIQHPSSSGPESVETGSARGSRAQSSVPPDCNSDPKAEAGNLTSELQSPRRELHSPRSMLHALPVRPRRLALAVAAWIVVVEVSTEAWFRSHEVRDSQAVSWSVRWPDRNATFESKSFSATVSNMLQYDEGMSGAWVDSNGNGWQAFYLRWFPASSFYGRMRVALSKTHNPEICLPASGLTLRTELPPVIVPVQPGFSLAFQRFVFDAGGKTLHVFFSGTEDVVIPGVPVFLRATARERLQAAMAGSRNFGQRNFEVAISGCDDPGQALRLFEERLPGLIQLGVLR